MRFSLVLLTLFWTGTIQAGQATDAQRVASIPPRPMTAMTGTQFIQYTTQMKPWEREAAIRNEILKGNVPDFLRSLKPVQLEYRTRAGRVVHGTVFVMPDYVAIGSNDDWVRIPMNLYSATRVGNRLGLALPTRKIVDAIFHQSRVQLTPVTMRPGKTMTASTTFWIHNRRIDQQLSRSLVGQLVSGHKKDVVLSSRLLRKPRAIAIYGWFLPTGEAIQPLSTVHTADYADYSHGIRFVGENILVEGKWKPLYEILEDRDLARLVSDEGMLPRIKKFLAHMI